MPTVQEGLYSYLSEDAALGALIATRIYPVVIPPQHILPALTYRTSGWRLAERTFDNCMVQDYEFELTVWADDAAYKAMHAVVTARNQALAAVGNTLGGVKVLQVQQADEEDIFDDRTELVGNQATYIVQVV